MFAIQGIYDDGVVTLNEPVPAAALTYASKVPVGKKYDVVVTFLKPTEPAEKNTDRGKKIAALNRITGILSDSSMTLEEARAERLSRQGKKLNIS